MDGASKEIKDVEYIIQTTTETYKMVIPGNWKITFGQVHGGGMGGQPDANGGFGQQRGPKTYVLRIYEQENKQRALFRGVVYFRDTSIPILKLQTTRIPAEEGGTAWADATIENAWLPVDADFILAEGDVF